MSDQAPPERTSLHVRQALSGDQQSLEWVAAHFHPFIEAQVRLRLGSVARADDVRDLAAEAWVVTLSRVDRIEPRDGRWTPSLMRWLGSTAHNLCNNYIRARIRDRVRHDGDLDAAGASTAPGLQGWADQTAGVITRVAGRELASTIADCLDELSEQRREILVLRLVEQRSNQEIADLIDIPANTVAVRYKRAVAELRDRLPGETVAEIMDVDPS